MIFLVLTLILMHFTFLPLGMIIVNKVIIYKCKDITHTASNKSVFLLLIGKSFGGPLNGTWLPWWKYMISTLMATVCISSKFRESQ